MLAARLTTGLSLVALTVALLWGDEPLAPWYPLWLLTSLGILVLCALELVDLMERTVVRTSGRAVVGGVLALGLSNWAPHIMAHIMANGSTHTDPGFWGLNPVDAMAWPLWVFVGILMALFVSQALQFQAPGPTLPRIAGSTLAIAYLGLLGSVLIQFRWLEGTYHGVIPLLTLVAAAKGNDIGAYTVGRLIGRRKLWPVLSPNKTVEGAAGGLVFGIVFSLAVTAIARYGLRIPTLGWAAAVGFGLLVGVAAQIGDLMESLIKRDCERKDASQTLPGFGGMLDVLDSLLFAAPVGFGYWLCFGP
ncbi:phosphatidate cytidylyltransferase [Isosphaeraceae bacterium EP7]